MDYIHIIYIYIYVNITGIEKSKCRSTHGLSEYIEARDTNSYTNLDFYQHLLCIREISRESIWHMQRRRVQEYGIQWQIKVKGYGCRSRSGSHGRPFCHVVSCHSAIATSFSPTFTGSYIRTCVRLYVRTRRKQRQRCFIVYRRVAHYIPIRRTGLSLYCRRYTY